MFAFDSDLDYYSWKNGPEEDPGEDPANEAPEPRQMTVAGQTEATHDSPPF